MCGLPLKLACRVLVQRQSKAQPLKVSLRAGDGTVEDWQSRRGEGGSRQGGVKSTWPNAPHTVPPFGCARSLCARGAPVRPPLPSSSRSSKSRQHCQEGWWMTAVQVTPPPRATCCSAEISALLAVLSRPDVGSSAVGVGQAGWSPKQATDGLQADQAAGSRDGRQQSAVPGAPRKSREGSATSSMPTLTRFFCPPLRNAERGWRGCVCGRRGSMGVGCRPARAATAGMQARKRSGASAAGGMDGAARLA